MLNTKTLQSFNYWSFQLQFGFIETGTSLCNSLPESRWTGCCYTGISVWSCARKKFWKTSSFPITLFLGRAWIKTQFLTLYCIDSTFQLFSRWFWWTFVNGKIPRLSRPYWKKRPRQNWPFHTLLARPFRPLKTTYFSTRIFCRIFVSLNQYIFLEPRIT